MKTFFLIAMALGLVVSPAHAQERTAAGALDTQMTWSALSNQIATVNGKVTLVDSKIGALDGRVNKLEVCSRSGRIYAPDKTGADSNGCIAVAPDCSKQNKVFDGTQCVDPLAAMNACATSGKLYNPATKQCVSAGAPAMQRFDMRSIGAVHDAGVSIGSWSACFVSAFAIMNGTVQNREKSYASACAVAPTNVNRLYDAGGALGAPQDWSVYSNAATNDCEITCLRF